MSFNIKIKYKKFKRVHKKLFGISVERNKGQRELINIYEYEY